jgi:hypothetical protein
MQRPNHQIAEDIEESFNHIPLEDWLVICEILVGEARIRASTDRFWKDLAEECSKGTPI